MTPFYERMPDVGGFGVEREVDIIGAALAVGAVAGVPRTRSRPACTRCGSAERRELPVIEPPPRTTHSKRRS